VRVVALSGCVPDTSRKPPCVLSESGLTDKNSHAASFLIMIPSFIQLFYGAVSTVQIV
jgi:hypothetical protein